MRVVNNAQSKGAAGVSRAVSLGRRVAPAKCFLLVGIVPAEILSLAAIESELFSVPWTLLTHWPFVLPYIWLGE